MNRVHRLTPRPALEATAPAARLRRVLYLVSLDPSQKFGTLEEQIFFLGQAFQREGGLFLPLFSCPKGPHKLDLFHRAGLPAECFDLSSLGFATLRRLLGLVRHHGIEVIHWNFTHPTRNPYLWLLSLLAPCVAHYYTDHVSRPWPLPAPGCWPARVGKRLLLRRYRRIVCVSRFVQDCLSRGRPWPAVCSCLHFVNADRFCPDPEVRAAVRRQFEAGNAFVAVVVAHLIPAKGIDVVCRALVGLKDVVLWVAGEGPEEQALHRLCVEMGVAGRVRFLGRQRQVEQFVQSADCLVCPSLWAEAAGLVNLEGAACGLPVVASRVGGIPEYVEDGRTGLLFEPGDHAALAGCLARLRDDPALRRRLGEQGRRAVLEHFSVEARLPAYLDLYRC
jgi:glycosyltransferase involved in cell wall biosynthesis